MTVLSRMLQIEGPGRPQVADSLGPGTDTLMAYARVLYALSFALFTELHFSVIRICLRPR